MLCAISGEAPQVPVASRKSGNVFEKRLIEAYIADHGTDPVNGEELFTDDLVELKNARTVRPRPPTLTSIPALLSTFQDEWDALALEAYSLKQNLAQTRQELSTALYDFEGALRVIAKVTKERDEARDALSKISVQGGAVGGSSGDAMQIDGQGLPESIVAKIEAIQQKLSTTRRKRAIPEGWATVQSIEEFTPSDLPDVLLPDSQALAVDAAGDLVLSGGKDGVATVYSMSKKKTIETMKCGASITDVLWWDTKPIIALSSGAVKIFENGLEIGDFTIHAGAATGLSLHPCGDLLASVGSDKSYVLYDLGSMSQITRVFTSSELTCGQFHPDGHLFAAGGKDGEIKLYSITTADNSANFTTEGPVKDLSFSENGTWLASASENVTSVAVWDLRKMNVIKTIDIGSTVNKLAWDYTGQFLAIAAAGCVAVEMYSKSSKKWSEPLRKALQATDATWGAHAQSLLLLDDKGAIVSLGS